MNFTEAANTLRQRFNDEFRSRSDAFVTYDNVNQLQKPDGSWVTEPKDSNGDPAPWVRFSIRASNAQQISAGSQRLFRQPGSIIVQIFIPVGKGDGKAYEVADAIAASLRGVTINGVRLKATSPPQFVTAEGSWSQFNSITPYSFDLTD